jgi:hypothetical protein
MKPLEIMNKTIKFGASPTKKNMLNPNRSTVLASNKIVLSDRLACKCACNKYKGNDGKSYWYNSTKQIVYFTDCHGKDPIKAIGTFEVNNILIIQK